jgi:hypothetical protein
MCLTIPTWLGSTYLICRISRLYAGNGLGSASPDLLTALKDQTLLKTLGLIGGEWVGSVDGSTFDVSSDTPCTVWGHFGSHFLPKQ